MNETHAGPTHANPNAGSTSRPKVAREGRKHPCSLARRGRRPPPRRRLRPAPRWRTGNRLAPVSGRRRRRPTRCQAEQRPRARAPGAPPAPSLPRRHRRLASATATSRRMLWRKRFFMWAGDGAQAPRAAVDPHPNDVVGRWRWVMCVYWRWRSRWRRPRSDVEGRVLHAAGRSKDLPARAQAAVGGGGAAAATRGAAEAEGTGGGGGRRGGWGA